jgi:hypothetical protein
MDFFSPLSFDRKVDSISFRPEEIGVDSSVDWLSSRCVESPTGSHR